MEMQPCHLLIKIFGKQAHLVLNACSPSVTQGLAFQGEFPTTGKNDPLDNLAIAAKPDETLVKRKILWIFGTLECEHSRFRTVLSASSLKDLLCRVYPNHSQEQPRGQSDDCSKA